jgi:hypothetical protein
MKEYVLLMMLTHVTITTFDLWMFKIGFDAFATIINFVNKLDVNILYNWFI